MTKKDNEVTCLGCKYHDMCGCRWPSSPIEHCQVDRYLARLEDKEVADENK